MKKSRNISRASIDRLSVYFRVLRQLKREEYEIISSEMLGCRLGLSPEQIRKDLAAFGEFGKKGLGYSVQELMHNISRILGLHKKWNIAILGVGHLGWALANNRKFSSITFNLEAAFDVRPAIIGKYLNGVEISHSDYLEEIIKERSIHIAVITTPAEAAQVLAERLVAAGIKGIWNFAPARLNVPENIPIVNEDLSIGLASLSYYISNEHRKDIDDNVECKAVAGRRAFN